DVLADGVLRADGGHDRDDRHLRTWRYRSAGRRWLSKAGPARLPERGRPREAGGGSAFRLSAFWAVAAMLRLLRDQEQRISSIAATRGAREDGLTAGRRRLRAGSAGE